MPNRLSDAVSPYLRSHADNPVDWQQWGPEPFAEAARRGVPVLVSIGYSTCHWCHVMARESFSNPRLAAVLNENFVAIKVDREEYPDVDSTYMAAAGAFTDQLGWPLNVFLTPEGRTFYAGTYWPQKQLGDRPGFRQVLEAVLDAWRSRRDVVDATAATVVDALLEQGRRAPGVLPTGEVWEGIIAELVAFEDPDFGGFGGAPKFPVSPVLLMLGSRGSLPEGADAGSLAARTLTRMAASDLRDEVDGGFFRYSTRRDWSEPHYERMLYDNAMLLSAYSRLPGGLPTAEGIARFLGEVMCVDGGGFASAQDSESAIDGDRVEGVYYSLDADARALQPRPGRDEKVLTGWNGLAIEALAEAGERHGRPEWTALARRAADFLLERHLRPDGQLRRASVGAVMSAAPATLEDYGMFAAGLLRLALSTGEVSYAVAARDLVEASLAEAADTVEVADPSDSGAVVAVKSQEFRVPGGADPTLALHGLALEMDPSEGAYPSGVSAIAGAAVTLTQLTADDRYRRAAHAAMERFAPLAVPRPVSFGAALEVMTRLEAPSVQIVVVGDTHGTLSSVARGWQRAGCVVVSVSADQAESFAAAGFGLFVGRVSVNGEPTAYVCRDFVCRLPVSSLQDLERELASLS